MLYGDASAGADNPFTWSSLIKVDPNTNEPSINAAAAADRATRIQFLEQAFEWDKMTYVLYPYFWADRASKWTDLASLEGADPEYVRFLRSGSARIVVSARPGFEDHVNIFINFGKIWSGGPVPSPKDPDYLSVAEEIKVLQRAPDDGEPLEYWDARLPTTLIWLQGATPLPEKPENERELGPALRAASGRPLTIQRSSGQAFIARSSHPIYIGTWLVLGPIFDPRHQVDDHWNDRQMGREFEHPWAREIITAIDTHVDQLDPARITSGLDVAPKEGDTVTYGSAGPGVFGERTYNWKKRSFRGLDWLNINDIGDNIHLFLSADDVSEALDPDHYLSFVGKHHALAFFLIFIHAKQNKTTMLWVRSDDALRVWLNGTEISELRCWDDREIDETEDGAEVQLHEGWNILLLGVAETHVEWGMSARFEDPSGLRYSAVHPDWLYSSRPRFKTAYQFISIAGDGNYWNVRDPDRALTCVGDGLWRGQVTLANEYFKFFADSDNNKSWGKPDGSNLEPLTPGLYEVLFNEANPFLSSFTLLKEFRKT